MLSDIQYLRMYEVISVSPLLSVFYPFENSLINFSFYHLHLVLKSCCSVKGLFLMELVLVLFMM